MVDRRRPGHSATYVTRAEVKAAQVLVRRTLARGETPSPVVVAIANAGRRDADAEPAAS